MKSNKKAVLGFALAMIISLGIMQGNSIKSNKQDVSMQQLSGIAGGIAANTEGFWSGFSTAIAGTAGGFSAGAGVALLINQWHPGGWVATGVIGGSML